MNAAVGASAGTTSAENMQSPHSLVLENGVIQSSVDQKPPLPPAILLCSRSEGRWEDDFVHEDSFLRPTHVRNTYICTSKGQPFTSAAWYLSILPAHWG
jgi:hypothetical protein